MRGPGSLAGARDEARFAAKSLARPECGRERDLLRRARRPSSWCVLAQHFMGASPADGEVVWPTLQSRSSRTSSLGPARPVAAVGLAAPGTPRASTLERPNYGIVCLLARLSSRKGLRTDRGDSRETPRRLRPHSVDRPRSIPGQTSVRSNRPAIHTDAQIRTPTLADQNLRQPHARLSELRT
jgi:hypothetical protein